MKMKGGLLLLLQALSKNNRRWNADARKMKLKIGFGNF